MLDDLTAGEFEGWLRWMRKMQPYPNRDDIHWGMLISTIHNQWSKNPVRPYEVMPYYDPLEEDIDAAELARRIGL